MLTLPLMIGLFVASMCKNGSGGFRIPEKGDMLTVEERDAKILVGKVPKAA